MSVWANGATDVLLAALGEAVIYVHASVQSSIQAVVHREVIARDASGAAVDYRITVTVRQSDCPSLAIGQDSIKLKRLPTDVANTTYRILRHALPPAGDRFRLGVN